MTPQERAVWVRSMGARSEWWARRHEAIIEPAWEVIDTHCHMWPARRLPDPQDATAYLETSRYLLEELHRDFGSGHEVTDCVYVECGSSYRADGPEHLRSVGETEFAAQLADRSEASGHATRIAALVVHADLRLPDLDDVLDAHERSGKGRVRGVRQSGARLEDRSARLLLGAAPPGLYADPAFRRGVARLGERGLVFEAFLFHFQLGDVVALARSTPGTTIVVNHLGAPIGFDRKPADQDPVFRDWAGHIGRLARLPNVVMKLGGLASIVTGYDGHLRDRPPASRQFVDDRGAYFHHAIESFGPDRCMFESNFPVDSVSISYAILWNAFKIIASDYDGPGRRALLAETARRVYRLN